MGDPLAFDLAAVLGRLQREHDVLPFLDRLLPAQMSGWRHCPASMMEQLRTSPDSTGIGPGESVWIALAAPDDAAAEIILYHAEANGGHYAIAPAGD